MSNQIETDVTIIGGGISGLSSAHFLQKKGLKTVVLEKSYRTGGSIRSARVEGFLVEYGPNSTLDTSPVIHELFSDIGIESQMEYANEQSKNRYILRDGRLNVLPMTPLAFLKTPHFSCKAKWRLFKEPFIGPADPEIEETLAQFVIRRLGQEFLDYAIDPFVAGIYAGLPERLSVKSAFPKLYDLEKKYGSLIKGTILGAKERKKREEVSKQSAKLFSFPKGLQTVTDALSREYERDIYLNSQIRRISKENENFIIHFDDGKNQYQLLSSALLLTIPVYAYGELPGDFFVPLLPTLQKIYYPPVTVVYFGYKKKPECRPLDGFGFLVPRKENRQILGTIWSSTIFKNRAPDGGIALTTFVGGSRQPEIALMEEAKLFDIVFSDLKDIMQLNDKPDVVVIQPWPKAIPQYNIGHQQILDEVEKFEKTNPGVFLSGNFRGGISVGDCIKQSKVMADRIVSELSRFKLKSEAVQV